MLLKVALGLLVVAPSLEQQRLHATSQGSGHRERQKDSGKELIFFSLCFPKGKA